ncbi:MAG: hypothetical protein J6B34_00215 [Clostridia bacterium]|nr:hypothetical protein [Clostridia bacterium]
MSENEAMGFLQVIVRTANGALPVKDASVNIYARNDTDDSGGEKGENGLLFSLKTNSSGKTEKIALRTKDKELSMSPGNPFPYTTYNISVTKDGYFDSSYINVPVFQGITALQPVDLIPLSEFSSPDDDLPNSSRRFVETPDNTL